MDLIFRRYTKKQSRSRGKFLSAHQFSNRNTGGYISEMPPKPPH
jgi:hypothetical protein